MPRKLKDPTRSATVLNKKVHPKGEGEDAILRDLNAPEFATNSDAENLPLLLALQRLVRGQDSLLEMVKQQGEEGQRAQAAIARLQERADQQEEAARRWEQDRLKFIEDVTNKADALRETGAAKDAIIAKGALQYQDAVKAATVAASVGRLKFEEDLAHMPKVTVTSPGVIENITAGGQTTPTIVPETVSIKHRTWVLQPGVPTEVPQVVAEVLAHRRKVQKASAERQAVLQGDLNTREVDRRLRQIENEQAHGPI